MNNPVRMPGYGASQTAQTDAGLRAHMLGVFRNMGIGLVIAIPKDQIGHALDVLARAGEQSSIIGTVVKGDAGVELV